MKRLAQVSILFSLLIITKPPAFGQEIITVIADQQQDSNTAFMQGFINGGASYNIPLTQELNPVSWGFGWDAITDYDYAVPYFNLTKKMVSIYSAYMAYYGIGDPLLFQPWTDWATWDDFV